MKLRPEEITSILRQRIEEFDVETNLAVVGTVLQLGDGIARIHGLENCLALEMLELEHGVVGLAFNLEEDNVGAALFGEWDKVKEGEPVRRTGKVASVPVGEALLGRVVDPLGNPLDGKGPIDASETRPLEFKAPGVIDRKPVTEPLQTGIKAIDSMIPIGRGQRELIIGDRSTGKTAILIDTILNQRDTDVHCIYVAIGQKASTVAGIYERLREAGAMEYTTIVAAAAHEAAPVKWMAPFAGAAMGEYFLFNGKHALVMYDDLSKHADAYRQLEAFAQFGSDLDRATQQALTRGEKMVATLNQPQYDPWPTEEQVVGIYAGIHGHLDDIPTPQVQRFQEELREHLRAEETVYTAIRETGKLDDDTTAKLDAELEKFKNGFNVQDESAAI